MGADVAAGVAIGGGTGGRESAAVLDDSAAAVSRKSHWHALNVTGNTYMSTYLSSAPWRQNVAQGCPVGVDLIFRRIAAPEIPTVEPSGRDSIDSTGTKTAPVAAAASRIVRSR